MLKSVSRNLSEVGRSPSHVGAVSRWPFNLPAMTRIPTNLFCTGGGAPPPPRAVADAAEDRAAWPGPTRGSRAWDPWPQALLSNFDQLEAGFPSLQQVLHRGGRRRRLVEPRDRFALRGVENLPVADEIHHAKRRHAGLPRAEEIPGAAKTQVALRDLEAVGRLGQRPEPLSRLVRERRL